MKRGGSLVSSQGEACLNLNQAEGDNFRAHWYLSKNRSSAFFFLILKFSEKIYRTQENGCAKLTDIKIKTTVTTDKSTLKWFWQGLKWMATVCRNDWEAYTVPLLAWSLSLMSLLISGQNAFKNFGLSAWKPLSSSTILYYFSHLTIISNGSA